MTGRLIVVGVIAGSHGVAGEVRVQPVTDFPERFERPHSVFLRLKEGTRPARVLRGRRHGPVHLVALEGIEDRTAAESLCGAEVCVDEASLTPLPAGHHYTFRLIGLRVETPDGRPLGTVTEVLKRPANDVFVVQGPGSERSERLVPAIRDIVLELAPERGVMVIKPPEEWER
ncbi:MAG: ribosome maturation factor RimM [Bacillota bacterium]